MEIMKPRWKFRRQGSWRRAENIMLPRAGENMSYGSQHSQPRGPRIENTCYNRHSGGRCAPGIINSDLEQGYIDAPKHSCNSTQASEAFVSMCSVLPVTEGEQHDVSSWMISAFCSNYPMEVIPIGCKRWLELVT